MKSIQVGRRIIGEEQPAFLLAELGYSHGGDPAAARQAIDQAAAAGFEGVNLRLMRLEEYMVPGYTLRGVNRYRLLQSLILPVNEVAALAEYGRERGLCISLMCHDLASVDDARGMAVDVVSVHSTTLLEEELLMKIASLMKPLFIKTSGTTLAEIERAIGILGKYKIEDYAFMHGFQGYPSRTEDANLRFIPTLKALYGMPVGYADHTDGESVDRLTVPAAALALGANLLEKHVIHDRSARTEGWEPALTGESLAEFVAAVRRVEAGLGHPHTRGFTEEEMKYREVNEKKTVARRAIRTGEVITYQDICFRRSDAGVSPDLVSMVIGRRALCDIARNQGITPEMFMEL